MKCWIITMGALLAVIGVAPWLAFAVGQDRAPGAFVLAPQDAPQQAPQQEPGDDDELQTEFTWLTDLAKARKQAAEEGKPLLVAFR